MNPHHLENGATVGELRACDGLRLHTLTQPAATEKAVVVITHGMGEHSGRYPHVLAHFAENGITACTYDLRGHGRSEGRRGYVGHYENFLSDLQHVFDHFQRKDRPVFLYGHSLGGQITVNFLVRHRPPVTGVILTSPWLDLAFRPPVWRLALAAVAAKIYPRLTQNAPPMEQNLSRDVEWLESLKAPGLAHRRMSAGLFTALVREAGKARRAAGKIKLPLLLMHGGDDPVTCVEASRAFLTAASSPDKELQIWPEMLHETHNELDRHKVLERASQWMLQRAP